MLDKQQEAKQPESLPSDVQAFCKLIARIMMRCLREKDPRVMEILSLSSKAEEAERGDTHDAA